MRSASIAAACALMACVSCSSYVVLTVEDPQGLANGADALTVSDALDPKEHLTLDGRALPLSLTVVGDPGDRGLWVDALSRDGTVIARGHVLALLSGRNLPLVVTLGTPCEGDDFAGSGVDDRCDDGVFCNGAERCEARVCRPGPLPCPLSLFSCVDVACLEEAEACGVNVHHERCGDPARLCDPGAGCVDGPACNADAECVDAFGCNGVERCSEGRCVAGTAPASDDGNACTQGACVESVGVVQTAANEHQPCPLPGAVDDEGVCAKGRCGLPGSVTFCTNDDDCDDGLACDGDEVCLGARCLPGTALVTGDGNPCTADACSEAGGVSHIALEDGAACPLWPAPDGQGRCLAGLCAHPSELLAAPTGLVATSGQPATIPVTWNAVPGATSYDVQHRVNGSASAYATTNVTAASATIGGVIDGTTYELRVRANDSRSSSAFSTSVTATPAAAPPGVPTGVVATTGQNASIPVSWSAVPTATSYDVRHRVNGSAGAFTTVNVVAASATISGVSNDTTYEVQVRANNTGGSSAFCTAVTATPRPPAPAVPTGLVATSDSDGAIPVSWNPAAGATSYDVRHRVNGSAGAFTSVNVAGTSTSITGLVNDTTYEVQVRANNTGGSSAFSAAVTATPSLPIPADVLSGWADLARRGRVDLFVDPLGLPRSSMPLSVDLPTNAARFRPNSVRLFEHDPSTGAVIGARIPGYVHVDATAGTATLIFVLSGTTSAVRRFGVYFDEDGDDVAPAEWVALPGTGLLDDGPIQNASLGESDDTLSTVEILGWQNFDVDDGSRVHPEVHNCGAARFVADGISRGTPHDRSGGTSEPASAQFVVSQAPTIRLDQTGFMLVESIAQADSVKVRELAVFVGNRVVHAFYRFENDGAVAVTNARYLLASDFDVSDSGCCNGRAITVDSPAIGIGSCAATDDMCGAFVADRAMRSFDAVSTNIIYDRLRGDAFLNGVVAGVTDVRVGASWSLGTIPANGRTTLRMAHIFHGEAATLGFADEAMSPVDVVQSVPYER